MMMSDLPSDLLEEILYRVPATTLNRLRPTCKRWNALFKNQEFTEKQLCKAPKQHMLLMLKELRVCPMSLNLNAVPPSVEFQGALDLKGSHPNPQQVNIADVFHCGGLLLCTIKHNKLVVWNPCLGETRWIEAKDARRYKRRSQFALGYQYNNVKSCHSFKILRYWDNCDKNHPVVEVEIYEFSSGSWRVLDGVALDCFTYGQNGVSLKGNTYWLAWGLRDDSRFLLSFDFTTERFRRLSLPTFEDHGTCALSLVREEKLSVLRNCHFKKMELWVTKNEFDSEAVLLWTKSFTVDVHNPAIPLRFFPFYTTFLLDEEKKLAVCCESSTWYSNNMLYIFGEGEEHYTEIPFVKSTNSSWRPNIFNYFPSLVRIQQGGEAKQKNETGPSK